MNDKETPPNPGSDKAVKKGCTCPIMDNGRGKGFGDGKFWINGSCPLHGMKEKNDER